MMRTLANGETTADGSGGKFGVTSHGYCEMFISSSIDGSDAKSEVAHPSFGMSDATVAVLDSYWKSDTSYPFSPGKGSMLPYAAV